MSVHLITADDCKPAIALSLGAISEEHDGITLERILYAPMNDLMPRTVRTTLNGVTTPQYLIELLMGSDRMHWSDQTRLCNSIGRFVEV